MAGLFGRTASQSFILLLALVLALGSLFIPVTAVAFAETQASQEAEQVTRQEQQPPSRQGQQQQGQQQGQQQQEEQQQGQQQERQRYYRSISNATVPLASPVAAGEGVSVSDQAGGSWALANIILCLGGLIEALIFIGAFVYRNRRSMPLLPCVDLMLRMFALCVALVSLIAASIVVDLGSPMVLFDEMSLVMTVLFFLQQAVLLGTRQPRRAVPADKNETEHFRARIRYEGQKSELSGE